MTRAHRDRCIGALVSTITVGLIDLLGLRDIGRESPGEQLLLALATAGGQEAPRAAA